MNISQANGPEVCAIAAMTRDKFIGGPSGEFPWPRLKKDFAFFKKTTSGHPVIMGRTTFEDILRRNGKPLSGRTNIVLTRNRGYEVPRGVIPLHGLDDLERIIPTIKATRVFIIGGAEIYALTMRLVKTLYLTMVQMEANPPKEELENWATFPEIEEFFSWSPIENHEGDEKQPSFFIQKGTRKGDLV